MEMRDIVAIMSQRCKSNVLAKPKSYPHYNDWQTNGVVLSCVVFVYAWFWMKLRNIRSKSQTIFRKSRLMTSVIPILTYWLLHIGLKIGLENKSFTHQCQLGLSPWYRHLGYFFITVTKMGSCIYPHPDIMLCHYQSSGDIPKWKVHLSPQHFLE